MGQLTTLPAEVTGLVSWELPTSALCNLRLTCRSLYADTFHTFTRRYIQTVPIMLGYDSLRMLLNISRDNRLASAVQGIEVTSNRLSVDQFWKCVLHQKGSPRGSHKIESHNQGHPGHLREVDGAFNSWCFREAFQQQTALAKEGLGVEILSEALMGLPNLQKIRFSDDRYPCGASRLGRKIGVRPTNGLQGGHLYSAEFVQNMWQMVLRAACRTNVREIDVNLSCDRMWQHITAVVPSCLILPSDHQLLVSHNFPNLTTLRLLVAQQEVNSWQASDFIEILRPFHKLTCFGLHFTEFESDDVLEPLFKSLEIKNLEVLELSFLTISATSLIPFLLRHREKLKKVELRRVNVEEAESWSSLFAIMRSELPTCSLTVERCLYFERNFGPSARMIAMTTENEFEAGKILVEMEVARIDEMPEVRMSRLVSAETWQLGIFIRYESLLAAQRELWASAGDDVSMGSESAVITSIAQL